MNKKANSKANPGPEEKQIDGFASIKIPLDVQQISALFPHFFILDQGKRILHSDPDLREMLGEEFPLLFEKCFVLHGIADPVNGKARLDMLPKSLNQQFEGNFIEAGEGWTLFLGRRIPGNFRIDYQEARFSHVFSNLHLGIIEVNLEDRILYANQSFCEMSGYREEEILGKSAREILLNRQGQRLMDSKSRLRKSGISDAYELKVINKDGKERFWLVSGAPSYSADGILNGSIGIHLDITEQKNLEAELIQAREQAESLARVKEDFLVNMSHEIRTPMHVITGMAELLSKTSLASQQQFYLGNIRHAAETMLALMNDILDLSKMEAGKLSLEQIPFEVSAVLKRMLQLMQQSAEAKGLDLQLNFRGEGISPMLLGDPHRLNQILYNLISNAIKFTSEGKISVECKLEKEMGEVQVLAFQVEDTGQGMDKAFLGRLFEKFSQEHGSVSRTAGGTGLGMNICKELIDLMGGEIEVKSQKNKGTKISFRIPFFIAKKEREPAHQEAGSDREMLNGLRVMLVDDNEMNRLVASTILSNLGAVVKEAENGLQAVESFLKEQPDLVLMDIRMPIMDGMEASREIRRFSGGNVPIVALTAHAMKSEIDRFYAAGMDAYLPKPFTEVQLVSVVAACLKKEMGTIITSEIEAADFPINQLWSTQKLAELSRGNQEFIQKMVAIFLEQTPIRLNELQEGLSQRNWKQVSDIAHKMKPSLDSMGIDSVKEIVKNLEKASEYSPAEIVEKAAVLTQVMEAVMADMHKQQGQFPA
jgi:PAS domain S-box-containing protein